MDLFSEVKLLFYTLTYSKFRIMETLQGLEIHSLQKYKPHRYADLNCDHICLRFADFVLFIKVLPSRFYMDLMSILLGFYSIWFHYRGFQWKNFNGRSKIIQPVQCKNQNVHYGIRNNGEVSNKMTVTKGLIKRIWCWKTNMNASSENI